MEYLILIHIGPVQEFIASARRSRDLWFGSWLLSELAKAAALAIAQESGSANLIFPAPESLEELQAGSNLTIANKIVGIIGRNPADVAATISTAILARLHTIRDIAYLSVEGKVFNRSNAWQQIDNLPEFYWVSQELPSRNQYAVVRSRLEVLMAARKNTRDFAQPTWGSPVPKSSLDGLRESVIPESAYDRNEKALYRQYGVRPGERLCGVGLLKRHGVHGQDRIFNSTSHIAALPLLQQIHDKALVAAYIRRLEELGIDEADLNKIESTPFGYDGHLIFEERLNEFFDDTETQKKAKEALRKFLGGTLDNKKPSPYYALLAADGDRMGATIDHLKTIASHRNLSNALSRFAHKVPEIVRANDGSPVYTGGDDVLAFVPLPNALTCAQQLAAEFAIHVQEFRDKDEQTPTLSVGIVITHHIEPLQDALELARRAEKSAKKLDGKNALAITLSKRSGVDRTVVGRWGEIDQRLIELTDFYTKQIVPDGAAHELLQLADLLDAMDKAMAQRIGEAEMLRILKRKRGQRGIEKISDDDLKAIQNALLQITAKQQEQQRLHELLPGQPLRELASEMIIASELAAAQQLATGIATPIAQKENA